MRGVRIGTLAVCFVTLAAPAAAAEFIVSPNTKFTANLDKADFDLGLTLRPGVKISQPGRALGLRIDVAVVAEDGDSKDTLGIISSDVTRIGGRIGFGVERLAVSSAGLETGPFTGFGAQIDFTGTAGRFSFEPVSSAKESVWRSDWSLRFRSHLFVWCVQEEVESRTEPAAGPIPGMVIREYKAFVLVPQLSFRIGQKYKSAPQVAVLEGADSTAELRVVEAPTQKRTLELMAGLSWRPSWKPSVFLALAGRYRGIGDDEFVDAERARLELWSFFYTGIAKKDTGRIGLGLFADILADQGMQTDQEDTFLGIQMQVAAVPGWMRIDIDG